MKIVPTEPPRKFTAGTVSKVEITECGRIYLGPHELVTFIDSTGKEYDVTAMPWGFYATPSANSRLRAQGFKTAIVKNQQGRIFIMLVDAERLHEFEAYLEAEKEEVLEWLDER
jgi:hypothetical protein